MIPPIEYNGGDNTQYPDLERGSQNGREGAKIPTEFTSEGYSFTATRRQSIEMLKTLAVAAAFFSFFTVYYTNCSYELALLTESLGSIDDRLQEIAMILNQTHY